MKRCDCGYPIYSRRSSDCTRAFCPMERPVLFNMTRALLGLLEIVFSIGAIVFLVWGVARWVLNG